jgi:hypothetical protein
MSVNVNGSSLLRTVRQVLRPRPAAGPPPLPKREMAMYTEAYFTLMRPSKLREFVIPHVDVWAQGQDFVLDALKQIEGSPSTRWSW